MVRRRYVSRIDGGANCLALRLRRATFPRACHPLVTIFPEIEVRLWTGARVEQLMRIQRGRKIKPVPLIEWEGEGRYARKMFAKLGPEKFVRAWQTIGGGVIIDFQRGEAFVNGDEVPVDSLLTRRETPRINLIIPQQPST